eukprot:1146405-Pyramimonas_sp.AAC.1
MRRGRALARRACEAVCSGATYSGASLVRVHRLVPSSWGSADFAARARTLGIVVVVGAPKRNSQWNPQTDARNRSPETYPTNEPPKVAPTMGPKCGARDGPSMGGDMREA